MNWINNFFPPAATPLLLAATLLTAVTAIPACAADIGITPKTPIEVAGRKLPVQWQIAIPSLRLAIETTPLNPAAWMGTSFPYWEGPIDFHGSHTGVGYLEMTGY